MQVARRILANHISTKPCSVVPSFASASGGVSRSRGATMAEQLIAQDEARAAKRSARLAVKDRLKLLTEHEMAHESELICQHVLESQAFREAAVIGIYVHCAKLREVDTTRILVQALASGKRVYVPVVEDKSSNMRLLHLGDIQDLVAVPPYGILEPSRQYSDGTPREDVLESSGHNLDLLLMPGLGFDRTGRRLGRGGGYYDKMLSRLQQRAEITDRRMPLLVALSYSAQLLGEVPVDGHDRAVDMIILPEGILGCTDQDRSKI